MNCKRYVTSQPKHLIAFVQPSTALPTLPHLAVFQTVNTQCAWVPQGGRCRAPADLLHSICQQIWKTQQWPQDWKRSVFLPIPKKGNAKECSSSVQFIHSVMSDSLWSHGMQHARPLCSSPTPGVYSSSCPLSWWGHPTISSSVIPISSCLQSFTASGSFPGLISFRMDWLDLLAVQGTLKILLQHHSSKA